MCDTPERGGGSLRKCHKDFLPFETRFKMLLLVTSFVWHLDCASNDNVFLILLTFQSKLGSKIRNHPYKNVTRGIRKVPRKFHIFVEWTLFTFYKGFSFLEVFSKVLFYCSTSLQPTSVDNVNTWGVNFTNILWAAFVQKFFAQRPYF